MRKVIVLSFMSLDGIIQAPGGQDEDLSNSFCYGGWSMPYWDTFMEEEMGSQMGGDFELLLGRKTYDLFAANWPQMDPKNIINSTNKYVVTRTALPKDTKIWRNSVAINGDFLKKVKALKEEDGPDLHIHGSSQLIQTLLKNNLIDEFWLNIFPLTLGKGKRLFGEGTIPTSFAVTQCQITPNGVILTKYIRLGPVMENISYI